MTRTWSVLAIGACLVALAFRVTLGVDLDDESYYAAFVDGWLKTGLRHSPFLMVHQTADLLVYPFAVIYREIRGSTDGLVLFLRFVYVGIATLSAVSLYWSVALFRGRAVATLAAALALFFVPFSLPAPSYNTVGMHASVGALSLFAGSFGRVLAAAKKVRSSWVVPWLSGVWWAVGCLAYPPMLVPLIALHVLALFIFREPSARGILLRYAGACGILLVGTLLMLCLALGPTHLLQMLRFTNAFNNVSGGVSGKVHSTLGAFATHPRFAVICGMAVLVSVARSLGAPRWRLAADVAAVLLIVGVATSTTPTFYNRAHDLVLVLALSGVFPAVRQLAFGSPDRAGRVYALVCAVSFIGGLTTAATAFNGLFNFPIGGFLAACLALVLPVRSTLPERSLQIVSIAMACAVMAMTTFTSFYGQIGPFSYRSSVRVSQGAFAGLRTDADQALFIARLSEAIERQRDCGGKFAVLGTGPGFYLMTIMAPSALSSWNYPGDARNFATDAVRDFYRLPANQPDVLAVNNWQWATPLSSSDRALLAGYVLAERVSIGIRDASVYRRADCGAGVK